MNKITIYTIGFTKKTAEQFFEALRHSSAKHLLDIRLNNQSQLAGFTRKNDLSYFLKNLVGMEYHEMPVLAPDKAILREYRKTHDWPAYEKKYLELIQDRQAENHVEMSLLRDGAVLLCSEAKPDNCHRRLAVEYLARLKGPGIKIVHL